MKNFKIHTILYVEENCSFCDKIFKVLRGCVLTGFEYFQLKKIFFYVFFIFTH